MADGDKKPQGYVGHGHPPVEHQFKKGISGNPAGRPRNRHRLVTQIYNELQKDIPLPNGNTVTLPRLIASSLAAQISRAKHTHPIELTLKIGEKAEALMGDIGEHEVVEKGKQAQLDAALERIAKARRGDPGKGSKPLG
jgi:hypothetical protein